VETCDNFGNVAAAARHAIAHCESERRLHYLVPRATRLHPTPQHETLSKILTTVTDLARRDFPRLDRSDVGRAHVAIHCSVFALVETGDFAQDTCIDPVRCSQMRPSERVRHPRAAFVSGRDLRTTLKWSMSILYVGVWLACVFVATTDEFHQSFVELRSASVRDVVVDRGNDCWSPYWRGFGRTRF
jgi:hypothetical protein